MARRVRESPEPADERVVAPRAGERPPHVEAVLRMQATAGNRATSRLIARDAVAPEAEPAEKAGARSYVLTIEGYGSYELSSFHTPSSTELHVTFDPGKDAARLMQAASEGRPIKHVTIAAGGRTITLSEALIVSLTHVPDAEAEPLVSITFDGKSLEVK